MALDSYSNLKLEIADWLNRSDLTAQIPTFIALAESEMKRRLRRKTTRTTLTISAVETTLPSDCAELRSIWLESSSPHRDLPFRIGTPEMVAERRARAGAVSGRPSEAFVVGGKLVVPTTPDQSYSARILYYAQLTPLSASVASNDVLTEAPDLYLFGPLSQAAKFLEHDARVAGWKADFDAAIDQLNLARENEEYSASTRDIRLPRVF